MQNNRQLTVYTTTNRKAVVYQAAPQSIRELFDRLKVSQPIPYTVEAYKALPKKEQDALKDCGGYVLGDLKNGRRRSGMVLSRSAAVLDADNLPTGGTEDFIRRVMALDVCCCVHSTAKHSPDAPRMRVVFPFAQDIPAEQYAPVVRRLCQMIQPNMVWFDPTTAETARMMYYASHCQDVTPVWYEQEGRGPMDAAATLAQLPNWQDPSTWPRFSRELAPAKLAAKQEDPTAKTGVVGAFCRAYDVPAAMDKYLPGVYEETATEGRYTFTGGSTWGGAILYDNGKFLFSHHATDPAGGKLVNAFDLVRLHRFGELDDEAKEGAKGNRLPSYAAMCDLAREDETVSELMARERVSAAEDFRGVADEQNAMELARCEGSVLSEDIMNLALKAFGIQVQRNLITGKTEITGMPAAYSTEEAVNTLPQFLADRLRAMGIRGVNRTTIDACLANISDTNRYNPVLDMLDNTIWDGESRFSDLLRILGISPVSLYAVLIRKWLIQSVAMAHNEPGRIQAAEGVLTLQGAQGLGKTWFYRRLAIQEDWFSEGVTLDFKKKDSVINATSAWITELGEVDSTLNRDQSGLKAFITQRVDRIRAPYAREATDRPRRTSFCATVNPDEFLKDETGDRRFWVVPVDTIAQRMLKELPESWFVQVWAEAVTWWLADPQSFRLTSEERAMLDRANVAYRASLPGEEEIREALDWDLPPEHWGRFTSTEIKRQLFFNDSRITTQQIGRVLKKLARENEQITVSANSRSGVKSYTLPLKKLILQFADTAESTSKEL